jgi:ZIP family zinc transporter
VAPELTAFLLASAAASAALLGWVAVGLKRTWTDLSVGVALLLSAGVMVVISVVELLPPGLGDPSTRTGAVAWLVAGAAAVPLLQWVLRAALPDLGPAQGTAFLVVLAIGLHNIPEGAVPFTAAMSSSEAGVLTAVAIGLHNIPEGMAVSSAVLATGGSRLRALVYTAVSVGGEILGAALMLAVGSTLSPSGAVLLGAFVAGIMISLCATGLIPAGVSLTTRTQALIHHEALEAPSAGSEAIDSGR